ncbi:MAG: ferredoxin family protein [Smithellaceae bacterium]|nr:ferredoxin family protein [Smithellaceae bacterium]
MKIDQEKCIACLECIDFCPMNCIAEADDVVFIDQDECVECGVCLRAGVCPTDAIYLPEEARCYPRALRAQFSDPGVQHPSTNQGGRGTEEMKTNDVTGRFRRGEYGMALEFGRPGTGARMTDLENVLQVLMTMDVELETDNAVFAFLEEPLTGRVKPEFRQEKVLSAILEFKIREDQLEGVVRKLQPVLAELDTVVSWGLATRFAEDGTLPVRSRLAALGVPARPNAKINMGLGRPIVEP